MNMSLNFVILICICFCDHWRSRCKIRRKFRKCINIIFHFTWQFWQLFVVLCLGLTIFLNCRQRRVVSLQQLEVLVLRSIQSWREHEAISLVKSSDDDFREKIFLQNARNAEVTNIFHDGETDSRDAIKRPLRQNYLVDKTSRLSRRQRWI